MPRAPVAAAARRRRRFVHQHCVVGIAAKQRTLAEHLRSLAHAGDGARPRSATYKAAEVATKAHKEGDAAPERMRWNLACSHAEEFDRLDKAPPRCASRVNK